MIPSDYQRQAGLTQCNQVAASDRLGYSAALTCLTHSVIGMSGEVGELAGLAQKVVWYGQPLDAGMRRHMADELGDVLWYAAQMCRALGVEMGAVMAANIAKLKARYPDRAWDADRCADANRDRTAEAAAVRVESSTHGGDEGPDADQQV